LGGKSTPAILAMIHLANHNRNSKIVEGHSNIKFRNSSFKFREPQLSLPLLVLGVLANHPHHSAPPNDLALGANLLY
jgi:hypothetical protein